jgi:preprotein translocase subunit SecA
MNKQREAVYSLRRQLMEGVAQKLLITEDYVSTILSNILDEFAPVKAHPEQWNADQIVTQIHELFGLQLKDRINIDELSRHELGETIFTLLGERYDSQELLFDTAFGPGNMRARERHTMLGVLDNLWKEHLLNMDHLKEGIGLRGYAQQDPLVAYKKESFEMFEQMMLAFQEQTARHLFRMSLLSPEGTPIESLEELMRLQSRNRAPQPAQQDLPLRAPSADTKYISPSGGNSSDAGGMAGGFVPGRSPATTIDKLEREFARTKQRDLEAARISSGNGAAPTQRRVTNEVGRNEPCPCGSGKKYKKCHGANA